MRTPTEIARLFESAKKAENKFTKAIHRFYPQAGDFVFYSCVRAVKDGTASPWQAGVARNDIICAAYARYVRALCVYYEFRDVAPLGTDAEIIDMWASDLASVFDSSRGVVRGINA